MAPLIMKRINKYQRGNIISKAYELATPTTIKQIIDQMLARAGSSSALTRFAARDINTGITNYKPTIFPINVGWGPKQTIPITHLSELPLTSFRLYNPYLYGSIGDTILNINESTTLNPLGIWFGTPTQIGFPATRKPLKYARARTIFSTRPYKITGELTLDKPLITIGDVPNREALEWLAERMGADGIIFNNIYDNGMNNTVSIKSFKEPYNITALERPRIEYYGPTMGKTTYVKEHPNGSIVDADKMPDKYGSLKLIRKQLAASIGLDPYEFGTDRVPLEIQNTPEYKKALELYLTARLNLVNAWMDDPDNVGKTLVTSNKTLLNPINRVYFSNTPSIPTFDVFLERNQSRGFRETPELLVGWWTSLLDANPNIVFDNRFISDIK